MNSNFLHNMMLLTVCCNSIAHPLGLARWCLEQNIWSEQHLTNTFHFSDRIFIIAEGEDRTASFCCQKTESFEYPHLALFVGFWMRRKITRSFDMPAAFQRWCVYNNIKPFMKYIPTPFDWWISIKSICDINCMITGYIFAVPSVFLIKSTVILFKRTVFYF